MATLCLAASATHGSASAIASGAHLLVSKTFGGGLQGTGGPPDNDSALGVAVDATDSVWVVGATQSIAAVPITPDAIEPRFNPHFSRAIGKRPPFMA